MKNCRKYHTRSQVTPCIPRVPAIMIEQIPRCITLHGYFIKIMSLFDAFNKSHSYRADNIMNSRLVVKILYIHQDSFEQFFGGISREPCLITTTLLPSCEIDNFNTRYQFLNTVLKFNVISQ